MASFPQIWDEWLELDRPETQVVALKDFMSKIYEALSTSSVKDERRNLAQLLTTVQNKIFSRAKNAGVDSLSRVLSEDDNRSFPIGEE